MSDALPAALSDEVRNDLLAFVEELSHLVGLTDDVGRVRYLNRTGRRWLGVGDGPIEALGLTTADLFGDEVFERYYSEIRPALLVSGSWNGRLVARRADGSSGETDASVVAGRGPGDEITWLATCAVDISDRVAHERDLEHRANHDPLTGLPNRSLFDDRLAAAIAGARRTTAPIAVVAVDLDDFKGVNDTYGHPAGDELLRQVTGRMRTAIRPDDAVARLGGDEFMVVVSSIEDPRDAERVAARLHRGLTDAPYRIDSVTLELGVSVGLAVAAPGAVISAGDLVAAADRGLYRAKRTGGDHVEVVDLTDGDTLDRNAPTAAQLNLALAQGRVVASLVPIVDTRTGDLRAVDAVPQLVHPDGSVVTTGALLLDDATSGGVGGLVAAAATRHGVATLGASGLDIGILVPATPDLLRDGTAARRVDQLREAFGVAPISLSVREADLHSLSDQTLDALVRSLSAAAVELVVDDYGTGSLAVSRLTSLPLAAVKLAPALLRDIDRRPKALELASRIGPVLGVDVIASGVERRDDLTLLASLGCNRATGPFVAEPDERRLSGA